MVNFIFRSTQEDRHPSSRSHPPNLNRGTWRGRSGEYRYLRTALNPAEERFFDIKTSWIPAGKNHLHNLNPCSCNGQKWQRCTLAKLSVIYLDLRTTEQHMPLAAPRFWSFPWLWCLPLPQNPCPSLLLGFGGSWAHLGFSLVPAREIDPREQTPLVPLGTETAAATKPWKKPTALNARSV